MIVLLIVLGGTLDFRLNKVVIGGVNLLIEQFYVLLFCYSVASKPE